MTVNMQQVSTRDSSLKQASLYLSPEGCTPVIWTMLTASKESSLLMQSQSPSLAIMANAFLSSTSLEITSGSAESLLSLSHSTPRDLSSTSSSQLIAGNT